MPDGPWVKYQQQQQEQGPWTKYQSAPSASPSTPAPAEEPGILSRAWNFVNRPLIGAPNAETNLRKAAIAPPTLAESQHPYLTGAKRGLEGAAADTISTLRGFTSPASIGLLAAGPASELPGVAGKAVRAAGLAGSAAYGAQGGLQAAEGAENIANEGVTPDNLQQTLLGAGSAAAGGAGTLHSLAGASPKLASKINNRMIGTTRQGFSFDRDPGLQVAKEGIVGNSLKDIRSKVGSRIGALEKEKQGKLPAVGTPTDATQSVLAPIKAAKDFADANGNPDLFKSLDDIEQRLTHTYQNGQPVGPRDLTQLSPKELNALKKQIDSATNWKQYGAQYKEPLNKAKVAMHAAVDEQLGKVAPEVKGINRRQSNLIAAKDDLGPQIARAQRRSPFGLGDFLSSGLGLGVGTLAGHPVIGPLAFYGMRQLMNSPGMESRVAAGLANPPGIRIGPGGIAPIISPLSQAGEQKRKREEDEQ